MKQCSKNYGSPVYSFRNVVVGLADAVLNIVELVAQMPIKKTARLQNKIVMASGLMCWGY
jgi:hypothetical protein